MAPDRRIRIITSEPDGDLTYYLERDKLADLTAQAIPVLESSLDRLEGPSLAFYLGLKGLVATGLPFLRGTCNALLASEGLPLLAKKEKGENVLFYLMRGMLPYLLRMAAKYDWLLSVDEQGTIVDGTVEEVSDAGEAH